jgi:repressor LexA
MVGYNICMKSSITTRQKELLKIIYEYVKSCGYPPSFEEMRENLKVSSNQSVIDLLQKLEQSKTIKREEGSARGLSLTSFGFELLGKKKLVPVVGTTAAGVFIESFEEVNFEWVEIPQSILPNEEMQKSQEVFIVKVRGDSMVNAFIDDGDMLLVNKVKTVKSGDIVIAKTEDGTTVKRFIAEGGKRYLKPENPAYANIPIIPGEISFEGKVIMNLSKIK